MSMMPLKIRVFEFLNLLMMTECDLVADLEMNTMKDSYSISHKFPGGRNQSHRCCGTIPFHE